MKASSLKKLACIKQSTKNKGLIMSVEVGMYDNGLVVINGMPMNNDKGDTTLSSTIATFASLMTELKVRSVERLQVLHTA